MVLLSLGVLLPNNFMDKRVQVEQPPLLLAIEDNNPSALTCSLTPPFCRTKEMAEPKVADSRLFYLCANFCRPNFYFTVKLQLTL